MHSPEVLAFSIYRPWPKIHTKAMRPNTPRWQLSIRWSKGHGLRISHFAYFNGVELYWPSIIDVWHMEPGGKDALSVCQKVEKDENGTWHYSKGWQFHFWHYKISWSFIYGWRRWLFTRCAECGGASRKGHVVNVSSGGWDGNAKTPLWCGEIKLFHSECYSQVSKQTHRHDPAKCYACSGDAAFRRTPIKESTRVARQLFRKR